MAKDMTSDDSLDVLLVLLSVLLFYGSFLGVLNYRERKRRARTGFHWSLEPNPSDDEALKGSTTAAPEVGPCAPEGRPPRRDSRAKGSGPVITCGELSMPQHVPSVYVGFDGIVCNYFRPLRCLLPVAKFGRSPVVRIVQPLCWSVLVVLHIAYMQRNPAWMPYCDVALSTYMYASCLVLVLNMHVGSAKRLFAEFEVLFLVGENAAAFTFVLLSDDDHHLAVKWWTYGALVFAMVTAVAFEARPDALNLAPFYRAAVFLFTAMLCCAAFVVLRVYNIGSGPEIDALGWSLKEFSEGGVITGFLFCLNYTYLGFRYPNMMMFVRMPCKFVLDADPADNKPLATASTAGFSDVSISVVSATALTMSSVAVGIPEEG